MSDPDWAKLEADVVDRIHMLRIAWEAMEKQDPVLFEKMRTDLFLPCVRILADFCVSVHVTDGDPDEKEGGR